MQHTARHGDGRVSWVESVTLKFGDSRVDLMRSGRVRVLTQQTEGAVVVTAFLLWPVVVANRISVL